MLQWPRQIKISPILFGLLFGACFCTSAFASAASNTAPEKIRLQLKWFHQFQFAGYYAAIEQGYYTDEGLEVTLLERDLEKSVIDQVIQGEAEYGIGDSGLLHDYAIGKPVVALAAIFQHNPLVFITLQSSGIISPYEMKGKRIMLDTLNANEAPLKALLANAKITENDFTLIKQSGDNDLLTRHQIDVMTGYLSDETFYYQQNGIPVNVINPQNYGIDFYGDILFTSEAERQQHPDRIDRFLRASLKGWRYALRHPHQIINLLTQDYHSRLSLPHLQFEAEQLRHLIPEQIPLGYIDINRLKVLSDTYAKASYNLAIDDVKLSHFIYQSVTGDLALSDAERLWLINHPVIRLGAKSKQPPYEWFDENNQFKGITADYIALIEQKLGLKFTIIPITNSEEALASLTHGEIDLLSNSYEAALNPSIFDVLMTYDSAPTIIIDNGNRSFINHLSALQEHVVAIEKDHDLSSWINEKYPAIKLIESDDTPTALELVEDGVAEAYVGDASTANYWIKKKGYIQLRFSGQTEFQHHRTLTISKQQPELSAIINKIMTKIDPKKINDIMSDWQSLHIEQGISLATIKKYGSFIIITLLLFIAWIARLNVEIKARKREIAARLLLQQRERRRNTVLNMLTQQQPLSAILTTLCLELEQLDPKTACHITLFSENAQQLQHGAAPKLPESYWQTFDGLSITGAQSPYNACAVKLQPVYIENLQAHPQWLTVKESIPIIPYNACWSQPILSKNNELLGVFSLYHLISKQPSDSCQLMMTEASELIAIAIEKAHTDAQLKLAASVFSHAREGIYITNTEGIIIECNDTFLAMTGYSREELVGQNVNLFKSEVHDQAFFDHIWQTLHEVGYWSGEIWNNYKTHKKSPGMHTISVIENENKALTRYLTITSDISALKKQQQTLENFAYFDNLTGLPNRLLLIDRIDQSLKKIHRSGQHLAIIFIDLDGFKAINDTYGHRIGDDFLVAISQQMKYAIRDTDTLGRLGGDEFIAVLNELEEQNAYQSPLEKLLAVCSAPILVHDLVLKVSASMGVRMYINHANTPLLSAETLLHQADQAMYIAKQAGKNNYHVFAEQTDVLM